MISFQNSTKWYMKNNLLVFTLFGHLQFVVITFLAMLVYSGGHALDIDHQGYQFASNFFSDLGMTVSHSSKPNLFSSVLFNISLVVLAISELSFYKVTAIPVVKRIVVYYIVAWFSLYSYQRIRTN